MNHVALDWLVSILLLAAAFFHFLINRDAKIIEPPSVVAARWILFAGLAGLGLRYLYHLTLGPAGGVTPSVVTTMSLLGIALANVLFGLHSFNKHHGGPPG